MKSTQSQKIIGLALFKQIKKNNTLFSRHKATLQRLKNYLTWE
jgi:hypothetical protein